MPLHCKLLYTLALPLLAGSLALAPAARADSCCAVPGSHDSAAHAAKPAQQTGDPYPLATDPVSGQALPKAAVAATVDGRQLRFASKQTEQQFRANPGAYLPKLDKQIVEQQTPLYPLTTCLVSGEKLGSMGKAVDLVHNNRLVRFCCQGCQDDFNKDPAKYLKQLDEAAIKAQKKDYALTTCPITGEKLGSMGEAVDYVVANTLIRLCCPGCKDAVNEDLAATLNKVHGAGHKGAAGAAPAAAHDHSAHH